MSGVLTADRPLDVLADFPAIPAGWAYLDTAATSQKPQPVLDAIARGYGETYATVHRGVYQRSAEMTLSYEAARTRVARFIGGQPDECVFVRGATEAINLVAQCWAGPNLKPGDRILLSMLEHHSNIVPWQMVAERTGAAIDVVLLTGDGRIDLEAMERMLTRAHKLVALAHVSNVLGSMLDAKRATDLTHRVGAKILLDGCQAVPRLPVDVGAIGCDFYVFSGHKLYGPTGIGVLWGRATLLEQMPPWQGGGSMIDRVSFERTTYAPPPGRFEAGTPHIVGALGLHAAIDYVEGIGLDRIHAHETALVAETRAALTGLNSVRLFGPDDSAGIVSFAIEGVHPHDVATILDEAGVAIRAGHHCAQPLMGALGVEATARASFGVYNGPQDVAALVKGIERVTRIFRMSGFEVEQVDSVPTPPKARVEQETAAETFDRKRDYLTGFLAQKPEGVAAGEPGGALYEAVVDALKEIYDPEIPVNIYELGLIYGVEVTEDGHAAVTMTLTTPHCPVAETMPAEVELRVGSVPGIAIADVNLVWDPPWDPGKMSDEAKLELGML